MMGTSERNRHSSRRSWKAPGAWPLLVGLVLTSGCGAPAARGVGNPDVLTREEIMGVEARTLMDVVQRLRPRWVEAARRGQRSFDTQQSVVVYQDQTFLGDLEILSQLSPDMAQRLEWLDGPRASATLPGLGSRRVAGAIVIMTRPT